MINATLGELAAQNWIMVPGNSVIFYPEWYFAAWNTGLGIACIALGMLAGYIIAKKRLKMEAK